MHGLLRCENDPIVQSERRVEKMGLAPKRRARRHLEIDVFAALVPVPLSRRANRVDYGPREKGTGTVRYVSSRFPA